MTERIADVTMESFKVYVEKYLEERMKYYRELGDTQELIKLDFSQTDSAYHSTAFIRELGTLYVAQFLCWKGTGRLSINSICFKQMDFFEVAGMLKAD